MENNLLRFKQKVKKFCESCMRDPKEIYVIAVSKTFPADAIASALDFNQLDFGENRVQEMLEKETQFADRIMHWHLIGHLQTNKVKFVVPFVFLIHSLDSLKLAQKIQSEAAKAAKMVKCLIQVNTSGEEQKSGCEPKHTLKLVKEIAGFENIKLRGLMTVAREMSDEKDNAQREIVRSNFRTLKNLFDEIRQLNIPNVDMKYLSMGMTGDFDIAIEEGSNMLRVGSAIFGSRN
ncbi:MAG: YggS family pyridoxal phosphate-dependent enzyme [Ignavibacteria bacterium]|nr:YggS family pyridoxal phosphate-dependent enzyme [Ignavibacteria bacterium]